MRLSTLLSVAATLAAAAAYTGSPGVQARDASDLYARDADEDGLFARGWLYSDDDFSDLSARDSDDDLLDVLTARDVLDVLPSVYARSVEAALVAREPAGSRSGSPSSRGSDPNVGKVETKISSDGRGKKDFHGPSITRTTTMKQESKANPEWPLKRAKTAKFRK